MAGAGKVSPTRLLARLGTYSTSKQVEFQDKRLGAMYFVACGAVLAYILLDFLVRHRYAQYEVPSGVVQSVLPFNNDRVPALLAFNATRTVPDYCLNTSRYNVIPRTADEAKRLNGWYIANLTCAAHDDAEIVSSGENSISFMLLGGFVPPGV
eukprot:TRINITY_DN12996_c0_g1_i2.p2 TRINITY_DN12996_c0_g1~~TRINITY_DN12996_c0_g1_i2.p2  ORF type:complete len:153 (+),score=29.34 TRINITY_DN12996_c0_g1_i2:100-558(+)